jgi:hypothetical protein
MTSARRHLVTAAAALGGLILFTVAIRRAGVADITEGVARVGWGLVPIVALAGLRFMVRAESWRLCMPPSVRLPFRQALAAFVAGDAMGNVTPLGLAVSEPTKVFLTRHRLVTRESVGSLAADNLIYASSVVTVLALGAVMMLLVLPLPAAWRRGVLIALGGLAVALLVAARLVRGTWDPRQGPRPAWRERLARLRATVVQFSAGHPLRLLRVYALNLVFHALAVVEVFVTLRWLLGDRSPTLTEAFLFEVVNRSVVVAFKFVPFRVGVDEAITGAFAPVLALAPATGVTLAVVRKVRGLFWTGVGLLLIAAHPAQAAPETDRPGSAPAHRT